MSEKHINLIAHTKERFINRELSWLAFNQRVLEEATNPSIPLLERLHFLAISSANLDEFTMVRVAGLKDQQRHGMVSFSDDGLTAEQQLEKIQAATNELIAGQQACWLALKGELKEAGIRIVEQGSLKEGDKEWLREYFDANLFPVLTPIAIDPAHPFPFLPNLGLAQIFRMSSGKNKKEHIAIVPFPAKLARFVRLPEGKRARFIALEEVIELFADVLFPDMEKVESALFRIIRDSDLDIEEDAEDLVRDFERAVKHRRRGRVIRIKFKEPVSDYMRHFAADHLKAHKHDVISVEGMLGLASLAEIYDNDFPELKYTPYKVRFPERINDFGGNCFAAIEAKDIVVHHPFESFDVVVQFLRQAADDADVISIKQTLYRTSKDSPIVKALIEAAEAGKSVTAVVELKARFDEEANIKWARDMERAGVQVVYGFVNLKTHAKVSLVTRRAGNKLRSYVHFGTGNYHPTTAKIYTDISFFTCDEKLCHDAAWFFNFVTGYAAPKTLDKLALAPRNLREAVLELIENEIKHAKAGAPAQIWAKMNSLVDVAVIDALYKASQAGVQIELIVRGICCLRPGVAGLSENIHVKSIVGRFLEHSRIFCFGDGHALPAPEAKVFISSADWMPRNFDWRVELLVPIENPTVHEQIMGRIMTANLKDEKNSWMLKPDGSYSRIPTKEDGFSAHEYFMNNPSLSGRGKALKKGSLTGATLYKMIKKAEKK